MQPELQSLSLPRSRKASAQESQDGREGLRRVRAANQAASEWQRGCWQLQSKAERVQICLRIEVCRERVLGRYFQRSVELFNALQTEQADVSHGAESVLRGRLETELLGCSRALRLGEGAEHAARDV